LDLINGCDIADVTKGNDARRRFEAGGTSGKSQRRIGHHNSRNRNSYLPD